MLYKQ